MPEHVYSQWYMQPSQTCHMECRLIQLLDACGRQRDDNRPPARVRLCTPPEAEAMTKLRFPLCLFPRLPYLCPEDRRMR